MKEVFEKIASLNNEYIKVWEDVLNIESPSSYKEGVDEVGKYFIRLAEKNGWQTEVFPQEKFGDVVAITMNPDAKGVPVILSGHMDTVHPLGLFGNPPSKIEGEKIMGPGAMDCKGGIVAGFLAMQALSESGYRKRPVMMLLQSNEEIGSGLNNKAPINWICEKAKDSVAFLNLEGYEDWFKGKACLVRKGIAGFLFTVEGISAHASYIDKEGASAIVEAAKKIVDLDNAKKPEGLTFNFGIINGGTASNTVPDKCTFKLDVRFNTNADFEAAVKIIDENIKKVYIKGCKTSYVHTNLRAAMELNERNLNLLQRVNEIFEKNGLSKLEAGKRPGGSDASDVTTFGIPCIDSLGVNGGLAHNPGEYALITSLSESAKRIATIVKGI